MTLTVRTDHRVSEALAIYCVQTQQTKSDVVKQALAEFLEREALPRPTGGRRPRVPPSPTPEPVL